MCVWFWCAGCGCEASGGGGDDEAGADLFGAFAVVGRPGLDIAGDVGAVVVGGPSFAEACGLVGWGEVEAEDVEPACFEVVGDKLEVGAGSVFGEEVLEGGNEAMGEVEFFVLRVGEGGHVLDGEVVAGGGDAVFFEAFV